MPQSLKQTEARPVSLLCFRLECINYKNVFEITSTILIFTTFSLFLWPATDENALQLFKKKSIQDTRIRIRIPVAIFVFRLPHCTQKTVLFLTQWNLEDRKMMEEDWTDPKRRMRLSFWMKSITLAVYSWQDQKWKHCLCSLITMPVLRIWMQQSHHFVISYCKKQHWRIKVWSE